MTTARDLIESAARKLHVLGKGETLDADDAQNGLSELNDIISSDSVDTAMIFTEERESFALTASQASYTIGSGGDFNTARPVDITSAFVRIAGTDYPLQIEGSKEYANITDKDETGYPAFLFYDANYPLGNIILYPEPNTTATLHIYSLKPLTGFATLDTVFSFPPEYSKYFKNELAVNWAAEFEREASFDVKKAAAKAAGRIKKQNTRNNKPVSRVDGCLSSPNNGPYNIYSGH